MMGIEEFTKAFIEQSKKGKIVAVTGAGISTSSGIRDFRGGNGIYREVLNAETILSHDYFINNPDKFYDFYKKYMIMDESIEPNKAHLFLKELEDKGLLRGVVTQNIDGLDKKAGINNVVEIHGNGTLYKCTKCSKKYDSDYILKFNGIPLCEKCGSILKPDIVLYGEAIDLGNMQKASELILGATTLLVIGTRLEVKPTTDMVKQFYELSRTTRFQDRGMKIFIVNMGRTAFDGYNGIYKYDGSVIDFVDEYQRIRK